MLTGSMCVTYRAAVSMDRARLRVGRCGFRPAKPLLSFCQCRWLPETDLIFLTLEGTRLMQALATVPS